jgi:hypothetical protein
MYKIKKKKNPISTVPCIDKKRKKDVDTVLKGNASKFMNESIKNILKKDKTLTESDFPFIRSFYSNLLKEQEEEVENPKTTKDISTEEDPLADMEQKSPTDFTPEKTQKDYEKSFDSETNPEDFDVEGLDPNISTESIKQIKEWSGKLDEFAEFLNDPSTESLHKVLADNDKAGSLLRGITRKASDSITRIAGEIEKLKEVLNSFVIMAPKRLRDQEQI